eukprot:146903_1
MSVLTEIMTTKEEQKGIQLLIKILGNILAHPNEERYRNLNFVKVSQKLQKCPGLMGILLKAGFHVTSNRERILFDVNKLSEMEQIYQSLLSHKINHADKLLSQINSNELDLRVIVKEGWLNQRTVTKYIQSWSRKWAVLTGDHFAIFQHKKVYKNAIKVIEIASIKSVMSTSKVESTFIIKLNNNKELSLQNNNINEKDEWINAIKRTMCFVRLPITVECKRYIEYFFSYILYIPYDTFTIQNIITKIMNYMQSKYQSVTFLSIVVSKVKDISFTGREMLNNDNFEIPISSFSTNDIRSKGLHVVFDVCTVEEYTASSDVIPNNSKLHKAPSNFSNNINRLLHNNEDSLFTDINFATNAIKQALKKMSTNDISCHQEFVSVADSLIQAGFTMDEEDKKQYNQIHNNNENAAVQNLLSMGFQENVAITALKLCDQDINLAVQLLIDQQQINSNESNSIKTFNCCENIELCEHLSFLSKVMREFNQYIDTPVSDGNFLDKSMNDRLISILNSFNHLMLHHDKDPEQFEHIYNALGADCKLSTCASIKRNHRDQSNETNNVQFSLQFLDVIHCHYQHGYVTFKLTPNEKRKIDEIEQKSNDKNSECSTTIKDIMKAKKLQFTKQINSNRFNKNNCKFSSDLTMNQWNNNCDQKNQKVATTYSYSLAFNYWKRCQYSTQTLADGHKVKDLYIAPKYSSLKDEILYNNEATVSASFWSQQFQKALCHQRTMLYLSIKATIPPMRTNALDTHPSIFGYNAGDKMSLSHLIVIMIYCAADEFQAKYSSSYRPINIYEDDDFISIKKRHSNFHYFAKNLREAVEVFGNMYMIGNVKRMYHGVNSEMIFAKMEANIYSPFSTTSEWSVAVQFASNTGMILELVPSNFLKYFACSWLSMYPQEQEYLFIGGWSGLNIVNITHVSNGHYFKDYITVLRILSTMVGGVYYSNDCAIIHKLKRGNKVHGTLSSGPFVDIPQKIKKLTIRMIEHELHRSKPKIYNKYQQLHSYAAQLLHAFCLEQKYIIINWKSMHIDVLKQYDMLMEGYIGFSFLYPVFCEKNYQGLNIRFITLLFPSLHTIILTNISAIRTNCLMDILEFIKTSENSTVKHIELRIAKEFGYSNILRQVIVHAPAFERLRWKLIDHDNVLSIVKEENV